MDRNAPDRSIPQTVRSNLAPGERILFVDQGIKFKKGDKVLKWVFFGMFGVIAVELTILLPKLISNLDDEMSLFPFLIMPFMLVIGYVVLKKMSFKSTIHFVVSNKKVYVITQMKMPGPNKDFINSLALQQLEAICVHDYKFLPDGTTTGTIDVISEQASMQRGSILSLPNVTDIPAKLKILDSIAWYHGKKQPAWMEPKRDHLLLDKKFVNKANLRRTLCTVTGIASGIAMVIGIIGLSIFNVPFSRGYAVPAELQFPFAMEMLSIFLFSFGIAILLVVGLWMGLAARKIQGTPEISGVEITPDSFRFDGGQQQLHLPFDTAISLDVIHPQILGKTGTIVFTPLVGQASPVRLGPFEDYLEPLEKIYYANLAWKARNGQLFSEVDLENNARDRLSRSPIQVQTVARQETRIIPLTVETPAPPVEESIEGYATIPAEDAIILGKYMESGEQVVFAYKPVMNPKHALLIGLAGIGGVVLFILVMANAEEIADISILLFIGLFMGSMLLFFTGMIPGWCMFINAYFVNRTLYVFTDKKIIIKYPNQVMSVRYGNVSFIERKEYRGKITLTIHLLKPLESSGRIPTTTIGIPVISNTSNLFNRIKELKDKFAGQQP